MFKRVWHYFFPPPTPRCPKVLSVGAQCCQDANHDGECGINFNQMAALMETEFRKHGNWDESR